MQYSMTEGKPAKSLILFALPMILGNFFQQLYNIIDSIVVGNYIGTDALAAVGASFSITSLFIAVATGSGIGCSVIISQYFGARQYHSMKTAIYTALTSVSVLSILLTGIGLILNRGLLRLMGTPKEIMDTACIYLMIYFWGLFFLFLYNILNSVFNALGQSMLPLLFLLFSSGVNIFLDLLFVIHFQMGVAGAAYATLISQGISALLSFLILMQVLKKFELKEPPKLFDSTALKKMITVAVPSIIQQSIVSIGLLLVQSIINRYGASVIAGYTAATKVDSIAIMPMVAVGNAMSTFAAQNIGAGKAERVKKGWIASLILIACISLTITLLVFLFGDTFIDCFLKTGNDKKAISTGIRYIRVVSLFYCLMGFMNVTNGILRGSGDMGVFMLNTLINFGTRVLLAYILSIFIAESGVWWSIPIGWSISLVIALIRFKSGKWKEKVLI